MLLALLLAAADAPPKPPPLPEDVERAVRVAGELEQSMAYDAARRQIAAVLPELPADLAADLELRRCNLWWLEGDPEAARACFERLTRQLPAEQAEARSLARYHLGALGLDGGEPEAARRALHDLVIGAPDTLGAHRALTLLRAERRAAAGEGAEADLLLGVASALEAGGEKTGSRLLAESLVEGGRLRLEVRADARGAERALEKAERIAAGTVWLDDARFWRGKASFAAGNWAQALAAYQRLIDSRAASWIVGTYDSQYHDDALYETGVVLEAMGEHTRALAAWEGLAGEVPESRLLDDAAFAAARLRAQRGDRQALARFLTAHPESRHVARAKRMLATR